MPFFEDTQYKKFVGQGIVFPIILENGKAPIYTGVELVRSSIRIILSWEVGNRFFLPEFASRLETLLFEPNDFLLKQLLNIYVVEALKKWEHRIELLEANIEDVDFQAIKLNISYKILTTNTVDTFIFPFYRKINY